MKKCWRTSTAATRIIVGRFDLVLTINPILSGNPSPTLRRRAGALGADWIAIGFGLGFVLSFGYWTTNFAEVQRALWAKT